METEIYLFNR